MSVEIPLIDFSALLEGTDADLAATAAAVGAACRDTGFFYVARHGISPDLMEAAFNASATFFAQPAEVKREVLYSASGNRGYVPMKSPG